jgi:hypothetical protein
MNELQQALNDAEQEHLLELEQEVVEPAEQNISPERQQQLLELVEAEQHRREEELQLVDKEKETLYWAGTAIGLGIGAAVPLLQALTVGNQYALIDMGIVGTAGMVVGNLAGFVVGELKKYRYMQKIAQRNQEGKKKNE